MTQKKDSVTSFDLVVAGGGLIGCAAACALAVALPDRQIALVEQHPFIPLDTDEQVDPRVVALTEQSRHFLETLDIWSSVQAKRISPYQRMHVWDAEGTADIHFDCRDVHQPQLGHIVENNLIVEALWQRIENLDNVSVLCPARIVCINPPTDHTPLKILLEDDRELQADLLIAADGAQSPVRTMTGLTTREWDYDHLAIVTTIKTEQPHQRMARQRFMASGPLALLPLQVTPDDEQHCSIVWSAKKALAESLLDLPDVAFNNELTRASENCLGKLEICDSLYSFPLRQRHATKYYRTGVVLCGDAAHTIHPLAGQGANLGFADVEVLAEEMHRATQAGIPLGDTSILARYQRRRIGENLGMMATMEGFKRLFESEALPLRWLRNTGMANLDRLKPVKNNIVRRAMGL